MTHVITSLCIRDNGCTAVCPVECISAGVPTEQWPTYYIDPATCIDCGACIPECPFHAIYPEDEVPAAYTAVGGEIINQLEDKGMYEGKNHYGEPVILGTTRVLNAGEILDLRGAILANKNIYK